MYYVGVDLGGTNIKVGICDGEGKILKKGSIKTGAERSADEITKSMADLTLQLVSEMGLTVQDIVCAGIATPGTADSEHGVYTAAICRLWITRLRSGFPTLRESQR